MELTADGRKLLEHVSNNLVKQGWSVQKHSFVTHRGNSVEIDVVGKKGRAWIAVECKAGVATAVDIGVLSNVPATHRVVVANKWADAELARIANSNSIVLIRPNEVEDGILALEKRGNVLSRSKSVVA